MEGTEFRARRAQIRDLLTCPICRKLARKITLIEECCHRFCEKCIVKKITEEGLRSCPECHLDLGCAPLQKLCLDQSFQRFRDKFSEKRRELIERGLIQRRSSRYLVKAPADAVEPGAVAPSASASTSGSAPRREEEKAISSLVTTDAPPLQEVLVWSGLVITDSPPLQEVSIQSGLVITDASPLHEVSIQPAGISYRKKSSTRKGIPRRAVISNLDLIDVPVQQQPLPPESPEAPSKLKKPLQPRKKKSDAGASMIIQNVPSSSEAHRVEPVEKMNNLLAPLSSGMASDDDQDLMVITTTTDSNNDFPEAVSPPTVYEDDNESGSTSQEHYGHVFPIDLNELPRDEPGPQKMHPRRKKKSVVSDDDDQHQVEGPNISMQAVADQFYSLDTDGHVWFKLVAAEEQKGSPPLPQIPASSLRVKDGHMPVSHIQKYLVKKLNLESVNEVEISLLGQPLSPEWSLRDVMNVWWQMTSKHKVTTFVGSSADEFIMMFLYSRTAPDT